MRKTLILVTLFLLITTAAFGQSTIDLIAGQHEKVGVVHFWNDSENLYVKYKITLAGWSLRLTHLYVGEAPPRKAAPGQFPYQQYHGATQSYLYTIPLAQIGGGATSGDAIYVAAHAEVIEWNIPVGSAVPFKVVWQGNNGSNGAYFLAYLNGISEAFLAWCIDLSHYISSGTTYYGIVLYSAMDTNIPNVIHPENLDLATYILNRKDYYYNTGGYSGFPFQASWREIQAALWILVDGKVISNLDQNYTLGGITFNGRIANAIANHARMYGEGFEPDAFGIAAFVLASPDHQTTIIQSILIEVMIGEETAWALVDCGHRWKQGWGMYFRYRVQ